MAHAKEGLALEGVRVSRGHSRLFGPLSLELKPGELLWVQGCNGAGKTSLLKAVCGLRPVSAGRIAWDGVEVRDSACTLYENLIYVGHQPALKGDFSALENLCLHLALQGHALEAQKVQAALQASGLQRVHQMARFLSQGQKQRVLLAQLLIKPARLWVLDEPGNALDGAALGWLVGVLRQHLHKGGSVVMTTHQAFEGLGLLPVRHLHL